MTIKWLKFAPALLALAVTAQGASLALAGSPCGCRSSCGCSEGTPLSKYSDGETPLAMSNGEDPGTGEQFDLGEAAPAQFGNSFAALDAAGAYIDSAIVATRFRMRFDAAYDNPLPDRAEFFYGQCLTVGPPQIETRVDYQDIAPYFEYALADKLSLFVETPIRFLNPEVNDNTAGIGDMNAGFKYAMIATPDEWLTAQVRFYAPTGDADRGLGTGHLSIEPSILYFRRMSERLIVQAEVRDWIPIDGSTLNGRNFSGNIVRYGLGFGYDVWQTCDVCSNAKLTAVGEFVGWTIIDGLATDPNQGGIGIGGTPLEQEGVTIVNAKMGLRYTEGVHSFYGGYGTALTNQVWYEDIMRFEYIRAF